MAIAVIIMNTLQLSWKKFLY